MTNPIVMSTYAAGYARNYKTDEDELRAMLGENRRARGGGIGTFDPSDPELYWWPTTIDFREEARRRPPAVGTANFGALLKAIKAHKRLQTVYWFGHGASGELQFGNGVRFRAEDIASLKSPDVSENFEVKGSLVLLACNAGQSDAFLQAIANALRVTVSGYRVGVKWRLDYQGEAPRRKITYRGLAGGIPDIQLTKFPQRMSK